MAAEKLLEAQKRYVMAKQRSDQFLAQVQRQYQVRRPPICCCLLLGVMGID